MIKLVMFCKPFFFIVLMPFYFSPLLLISLNVLSLDFVLMVVPLDMRADSDTIMREHATLG